MHAFIARAPPDVLFQISQAPIRRCCCVVLARQLSGALSQRVYLPASLCKLACVYLLSFLVSVRWALFWRAVLACLVGRLGGVLPGRF